jgi:hypothetical protein
MAFEPGQGPQSLGYNRGKRGRWIAALFRLAAWLDPRPYTGEGGVGWVLSNRGEGGMTLLPLP